MANKKSFFIFLLILCVLPIFIICVDDTCPGSCLCKWKGGKRTVECTQRGLITVPENADPETQVLDLSDNNLQILPRQTFSRSRLVNLQRVYLRNCRIGEIDDQAFKRLTNLIELDLSNNLLTSIPSKTFHDIPFLRELLISNNPIQKIDATAFMNLRSLVKLDISHCEITMIAPRAFEGVEGLESLKIHDNQLSELRPHTVEILEKIHAIELHNNPWHCDCRLRVIKKWLIDNNISIRIQPICSGGPHRLIKKSFNEIHLDDLACKPEILRVDRRYIMVTAGENATIICSANAIPSAHIKWHWNGKLLNNHTTFVNNENIQITEDGKEEKKSILTIINVQKIDRVDVYCTAENRAGSTETNFTLSVVPKGVGISSLNDNQIAGLSAALALLFLLVLIVICVMLIRMKSGTYVETKTPRQLEVVTVVNGSALPNGKVVISPTVQPMSERIKQPSDLNLCNPIQKPPRTSEPSYSANGIIISPSSNSGNNPDLISDMRQQENNEIILNNAVLAEHYDLDRPASGEYSRNADSLYPSTLWENDTCNIQRTASNNSNFYDDKTPIIEGGSSSSSSSANNNRDENLSYRNKVVGYPQDYGLPVPTAEVASSATQVTLPTTTKTLRVWQKGGVPVLPPVTALKRALSSNRNSPDEGYQEGCGTDV